jgi:hypothetical protein
MLRQARASWKAILVRPLYGPAASVGSSSIVTLALVGTELEENLSLRYLAAAVQRAGRQATIVHCFSEDEVK